MPRSKSELTIYEPMLKLELRIFIGEKWKSEYKKYSWHKIRYDEVGCTHTLPIVDWENAFWMIWIDDIHNITDLVHELYHLVQAIRHSLDLCEETWSYLIWYLASEII